MSRSSKKGPYVDARLMARVEGLNATREKRHAAHLVAHLHDLPRHGGPYRSWSTTGASTCPCSSSESMVGHKLGEFAPTRTYRGHASDKQSKRR